MSVSIAAPTDLLEREELLDRLARELAESSSGNGRFVLLAGEAGAGKTALVRAFGAEHGATVRLLSGACDALITPRPLGPLADVAAETGGDLEELVETGARPHQVLRALLEELRGSRPTLLVLEDVHWADEATLDVLRLLARRVETVPALVLATWRDEELDRAHPLRILVGEVASSPAVTRVSLPRSRLRRYARLRPVIRSTRTSCTTSPAGTPSSSPRFWLRRAQHFPRACEMRCWRVSHA